MATMLTVQYQNFLATMLTGKGNLDDELLLASKPLFEGARAELSELLSEQELFEYTGNVFLPDRCTSVYWTGFNGESRVAVLSEFKKMIRFTL